MKRIQHIIKHVERGSTGEELELEAGDELLAVNGKAILDVLDFHYIMNDDYIELLVRKQSGEEWELEVEKDYDDDLGISFENDFMDDYKSCSNNCIFCFIDQMPKGLRETLYFKDDDSRLSFLQGNYVTLTNMKEEDLDRIIRYHLSPINVSVHTTNPQLRKEMLGNRFAGDLMAKLEKLCKADVEMNGQVVLCKGVNDGCELDRTVGDLAGLMPAMSSMCVVPVGISKYRDGLYPMKPFNREDACRVVDQVEGWQKKLLEEKGSRFVYCSDEWYVLAERPLPDEESYEGYPQLENGVGMLRSLREEVTEALKRREGRGLERKISIATGYLPYVFIKEYTKMVEEKFPGLKVDVYPIRNDFFGETITVSGLLTGQDLAKQLRGQKLGMELLLPCNMLRSGESVFLDDYRVSELERELDLPIRVVDEGGEAFVRALLGEDPERTDRRRQIYEQADCSHCGQT